MERLRHPRLSSRAVTARRVADPAIEPLEGRTMFAAAPVPTEALELTRVGGFKTGGFDEGAAEISAYEPRHKLLFVVNAEASTVDVLSLADPANPTRVRTLDVAGIGAPNSVAVHDELVAVALEDSDDTQAPGRVAFFSASGTSPVAVAPVGSLPDMLTFTPDGRRLLVANEGEPNADYSVDPEGTITSISIPPRPHLLASLRARDVKTIGFAAFNSKADALRAQGVRIFGPGATVAQDFEPEYIAVSPDGRTAYVTLQENNAYATIDLRQNKVTRIVPLGYKGHAGPGAGFDASDRDGKINITNHNVFGMYQPDAIAAFDAGGETFLVTANEGDVREYDTFAENARIADLTLDPTAFPNAAELQSDEVLGRLTVTTTRGDIDGDGDYDELYAFGARSFTIRTADGRVVYDSGDDFEQITAAALPANFNASHTNNTFDNRSDDKGPEPEGVTLGVIAGRTYAFVGLERVGGVMVYDVTDPTAPQFVRYVNTRDFAADPETPEAGDLGPEGLTFVPADKSPNGKPLLIVANEVSGTVGVFEIDAASSAPPDGDDDGDEDRRRGLPSGLVVPPAAAPLKQAAEEPGLAASLFASEDEIVG